MENKAKLRRIALLSSGLVYAISLFCPVFKLAEGNSSFLLGFVCLLFGFGKLPWYANLFYFASLIALFLRKALLTVVLAVVAVALALTTLGIEEMPRNEADNMTAVVGYGPGFYLWLGSMLIVLLAAFPASATPKATIQTPP